MKHTAQRHHEVLREYEDEYAKFKVQENIPFGLPAAKKTDSATQANLELATEKSELLGGVLPAMSNMSTASLLLLRERSALNASHMALG